MRSFIGPFLRANRLLVLALVLVLMAAVFFGLGALRHSRAWDPAGPRAVEAWMTPRFVVRNWDLPREVMVDVLSLPREEVGRVPLREIARERDVTVEDLIAEIEAAIAAHRAGVGQ